MRLFRWKRPVEALFKIMPRKKSEAMKQAELFEKAVLSPKRQGKKALAGMLAAGTIERIDKVDRVISIATGAMHRTVRHEEEPGRTRVQGSLAGNRVGGVFP